MTNNNVGYSTDDITGLGNRFFFHSARVTYFSGFTRTGNITTGPILMPGGNPNRVISCPPQMFLNAPPNIVPQANPNDTLVVLSHTTDEGEGASVYNLYNLTQNKIHYTKTMIGDSSGAFGLLPSIHSGKVYFPSGLFVLCFDLKTGNEVWRTEFSSVFFGVGPVIHNNKMYCNNNDGFSYCLDPETGKILWKTRTRGGTSLPFYLNGVVYFTSIADGHLYGLDAEDGKILMKIDDPRGGIGFGDMVAGADGKIYANTYTHLYCFKAAR
jgi:outer membrane protein assembly factor BamB